MAGDDDPAERLGALFDRGTDEEIAASVERFGAADPDARKRTLQAVREVAERDPSVFAGVATPLATFLTDEERAVRLTVAKLFVTVAASAPGVVLPVVDALAERLADEAEFYYVRARCAEALGYVATDHHDAVTDPGTLAEFRVGLSFDEPEVREKLAKALACVALGDPSRLRHRVASLADHLDDEAELVRYHLCTALVVVGCEHPERLADAAEALRHRLTDENPYVRGRAAEALALLAQVDAGVSPLPELDGADADDPPAFLTERVRFARRAVADGRAATPPDGVGTVASVRDGSDDVVAEMLSSGEDCPACGFEFPDDGPPMCPRCGAVR